MSFSQAGTCPKCGAPLWVPAVWHAIVPPPVSYSCGCNPGSQNTTTGVTTILLPPAMQAAQLDYQRVMGELEKRKGKSEVASSPEGVLQRLAVLEQTILELCEVIKKLTDATNGKPSVSARKLLRG